VGRNEIVKASASEFLVFAIQRFGNSVGIEQQAEIMAEGHGVLGELAGKQTERHAGVGVERAHAISMAQQGPGMTSAGEGESSACRIEDGIDHGDVAASRYVVERIWFTRASTSPGPLRSSDPAVIPYHFNWLPVQPEFSRSPFDAGTRVGEDALSFGRGA